jgi:hypothetical protein
MSIKNPKTVAYAYRETGHPLTARAFDVGVTPVWMNDDASGGAVPNGIIGRNTATPAAIAPDVRPTTKYLWPYLYRQAEAEERRLERIREITNWPSNLSGAPESLWPELFQLAAYEEQELLQKERQALEEEEPPPIKPLPPEPPPRPLTRTEIRKMQRRLRPHSHFSVRTLSGGLPSLGKRR